MQSWDGTKYSLPEGTAGAGPPLRGDRPLLAMSGGTEDSSTVAVQFAQQDGVIVGE